MEIEEGKLYDFCLDWQMEYISYLDMKKTFIEHGWDYLDFEEKAKARNWFVKSMKNLEK